MAPRAGQPMKNTTVGRLLAELDRLRAELRRVSAERDEYRKEAERLFDELADVPRQATGSR